MKNTLKYGYKLTLQERSKIELTLQILTTIQNDLIKTVSVLFKLRLYCGRDTLREWTT